MESSAKNFKILKTTPLPDSEMEIEAEIPAEEVSNHRQEAIKNLNQRLKIDGFREGHIPEKVLLDRVGETGLLEEAASLALEHSYLEILRQAKINPVGRPNISIIKLAGGNPLVFKIKLAVVPEVNLPDYKKIAEDVMSKKESVEVSDQEFEEALNQIRKSQIVPVEDKSESDTPLPELTDEMVKKFGDFANVQDFKEKLRQNILAEKELRNREKKRLLTIEKIITGTKVELPKVLIESEQEKMASQFKANIESMGLKPEEYFKQIGKTEEDIKAEWSEEAKKRAKMELILQKIALEEKIEPIKEDVEKETEHLLSHYQNADPIRARIYIEQILTNERVWRFLEDLGSEQK